MASAAAVDVSRARSRRRRGSSTCSPPRNAPRGATTRTFPGRSGSIDALLDAHPRVESLRWDISGTHRVSRPLRAFTAHTDADVAEITLDARALAPHLEELRATSRANLTLAGASLARLPWARLRIAHVDTGCAALSCALLDHAPVLGSARLAMNLRATSFCGDDLPTRRVAVASPVLRELMLVEGNCGATPISSTSSAPAVEITCAPATCARSGTPARGVLVGRARRRRRRRRARRRACPRRRAALRAAHARASRQPVKGRRRFVATGVPFPAPSSRPRGTLSALMSVLNAAAAGIARRLRPRAPGALSSPYVSEPALERSVDASMRGSRRALPGGLAPPRPLSTARLSQSYYTGLAEPPWTQRRSNLELQAMDQSCSWRNGVVDQDTLERRRQMRHIPRYSCPEEARTRGRPAAQPGVVPHPTVRRLRRGIPLRTKIRVSPPHSGRLPRSRDVRDARDANQPRKTAPRLGTSTASHATVHAGPPP